MRKLTRVAFALFAFVLVAALVGPMIWTADPNAIDLPLRLGAPTLSHPLGLDQNGADVLSQTLLGARTTLVISFAVVSFSLFIGLLVGSLAGWKGGAWDLAISRGLDMLQAFPGFLLSLAMVAVMGPSVKNLILAMTITGWTGYARIVRAQVQQLRTREFVSGARALGASTPRLLVLHVWPNLAAVLAVQCTFGLSGVILAESGLSFLGLGVPADVPTWGALINSGRRFLAEAPHISLFPGLALATLVFSIQLLGESLRRRLNPREQTR
ncbi:MAG: ABC transporter permease [Bdellovibrionota bacterium]